jgi:hypothetical protein
MATVSLKELERGWNACFQGRTLTGALVNSTPAGGTPTVADYLQGEVSAAGYARQSGQLLTSSFSATAQAQVSPSILFTFGNLGVTSYSFSTLVLFLDGEDYPYSVVEENPSIAIAPGQIQTYTILVQIAR